MKHLFSFFIVSLFLHPLTCFSQSPDWVSFTNGHKVVDIIKDSDILWVATTGGLVRVDLVAGDTLFVTKSNTDLESYNITAIEVDLQHNLWVGTDDDGIFLYDGSDWITNPYGVNLTDRFISDIKRDNSGNIWVGCEFRYFQNIQYGGLFMYDGNTWNDFTNSLYNSDKSVYKIECDKLGYILIAEETLTTYDGTNWIHDSTFPVYNLAVDSLNNVWVLKDSSTLAMFDGSNWNNFPVTPLITHKFLGTHSIVCDSVNNIWLGSDVDNNLGLLKFDGNTWSNYSTSNSGLTNDKISSLYYSENQIFVGTNSGRLNILNPSQTWELINTSNSLINDNYLRTAFVDTITGIVYTSSSIYLVDSTEILVSYDGQQWNFIDSLPTGVAESIYMDSQNKLWAAGYKGVAFHDGLNWTFFDTSNTNFPESQVNSITGDTHGNIWIAGGSNFPCFVAKYDGSSWTVFNPPAPGGYTFNKIVIDNADNKWIVDYYGLFELDNQNQWHVYNNFNCPIFVNNAALDISYSPLTDALFIASSDGIVKCSQLNFSLITFTAAYCIEVDKNGNIWTNPFYRDSLLVYNQSGQLIDYFTSENSGLPYLPFVQDFTISNNGEVYMATGQNGLVVFSEGNTINVHEVDNQDSNDFFVYPNPFVSDIFISIQSQSIKNAYYSLKNIMGQTVIHASVINPVELKTESLDLSFLSSGIYLLELTIDGQRSTQKIVKE